jgi:hypothetical protein
METIKEKENLFQTEVMKEKCKKYKKKKKIGASQDKIDEFEKITCDAENNDQPARYKSFENFETIREGLMTNDGIAVFTEDMWDGVSKDKDNKPPINELRDPRQILVDAINYTYEYVNYMKMYIGVAVCLILGYEYSKSQKSKNYWSPLQSFPLNKGKVSPETYSDAVVINNELGSFICIILANIVVYHIFFVTFFRENNERPVFWKATDKTMEDYIKWGNFALFRLIGLNIAFEIAFNTPVMMTPYFLSIPEKLKSFSSIIFFLIFFGLINIFYYLAPMIKQFLIDMIMLKPQPTIMFFYVLVLVKFLTHPSQYYLPFSKNPQELETKKMYFNTIFKTIPGLIFFGITFIIPFIVVMIFGPLMCSAITTFYIFYLCTLPILQKSEFDVDKYKELCRKIDDFVKVDIKPRDECDAAEGIIDLIKRYLIYAYNFFEENMVTVMIIYTIFESTIKYSAQISNPILRNRLYFFNISFIILIIFYKVIYNLFFSKQEDDENSKQIQNVINKAFETVAAQPPQPPPAAPVTPPSS